MIAQCMKKLQFQSSEHRSTSRRVEAYPPLGGNQKRGLGDAWFNPAGHWVNWKLDVIQFWVVATQISLIFTPILGEMIQVFDEYTFQMGGSTTN